MNISVRIILIFVTILGLLGAIVVSMSLLADSRQQTAAAELRRFQSNKLSDQLRQSSDDLTRMARTYVVTGDLVYEQYFYEILAIRDGTSPRPKNYGGIYWDYVTATKEAPTTPGAPVAFIELMKQVGITSQEMEKLEEAKNNSDQLTDLEIMAFGAMKGLFVDNTGKLTIHREPDRAFARKILHGDQYHKAKAEIMRPIGEFIDLLDQRTRLEVTVNRAEVDRYQIIATTLVAATILFSIFAFFHIRGRIIAPIVSLSTTSGRIQSGAMDERAIVTSADEVGTLASAFNGMVESLQFQITERQKIEEELRGSKAEAEQANKSKSDFLSSMSHELRTPLNAILGFSQVLELNPTEPLTESQKASVKNIKLGGQHLLELINEILDLAGIEAGKVSLSIEKVALGQVLDECLTMVNSMAEERGISVEVKPGAGSPPTIRADYRRFKQALLNLMTNAVKYNHDGGQVTVEIEDTGDGMVRVSVSDTGPGIPKDSQAQLFQPFNRLGAEMRETEGTGIGLTITKQLVELMGGRIDFESEEGQGTTFWVDMPIMVMHDAETGRAEAAADETPAAANVLPDIAGTVLYVEDNPANVELMEIIVDRIKGLELISANSAETGLELAENRHPDLIILDINLPGMDGFEALERLRKNSRTKDIPAIALSANAMQKDIKRGLAAGFKQYLTKPIKVEEVVNGIKSILEDEPPN